MVINGIRKSNPVLAAVTMSPNIDWDRHDYKHPSFMMPLLFRELFVDRGMIGSTTNLLSLE